jgi:outer membrane protein assembly factor BamE (lipoprotein component of BamABCDE complex)
MFFNCNHNFKIILIFFILIGCQLQDPNNNHGIVFLENRSNELVINKSNKNDVLNLIGQPHSKSINNDNEWFYIERILTKGEFHKLGQNILKENNVLVLDFDKYGILKYKKMLDKNDIKKMKFLEKNTENELAQKSFIEKFLSSIRTRMYKRN